MRGWREELLKCNEKEVYLKIDNENTEVMEGIAKVIKDKSKKIQNKILVVGDRRIFDSIIIRSELCKQRLFVDDEHKIRGDGNTGKSIYFRRRIDQSLRGRRFDITIISIPSSLDNEIIRQARLISNQVIVLVDRDQTIINKKLIEVDEHKYNKSNGELLKDEIKRLYEELAEIPHNERTTMTREKIVDMIFKLERLDSDKYSYINNYEDKVVMGVGDNNCESRSCINSDSVQVEVCKLYTYKN